jgi:hypothetical protein
MNREEITMGSLIVSRLILLFIILAFSTRSLAQSSGIVDIDVSGLTNGKRTLSASVPTALNPTLRPSVVPTATFIGTQSATPVFTTVVQSSERYTPTVVSGVFKMKDLYQSGVEAYREKDFEKAIRYFRSALNLKDAYTPRYYYAEAHTLLGVIYQFSYPVPNHLSLAEIEYRAALKIDPETKAAKKHLAELLVKQPK